MCRFLRSGTSGWSSKWGYRGFNIVLSQIRPSFCSLRNYSLPIYGLVFNLNFVKSSDLSALNNARSEKFNNFLFTLSYSTRTDPSFSEITWPGSDLHLCLLTQHHWIQLMHAWPCIDHKHWEIHQWSTLVLVPNRHLQSRPLTNPPVPLALIWMSLRGMTEIRIL